MGKLHPTETWAAETCKERDWVEVAATVREPGDLVVDWCLLISLDTVEFRSRGFGGGVCWFYSTTLHSSDIFTTHTHSHARNSNLRRGLWGCPRRLGHVLAVPDCIAVHHAEMEYAADLPHGHGLHCVSVFCLSFFHTSPRLTLVSSLAVHVLSRLGRPVPPPRSYSPAGLLGFPLDGNLIGGALLGAGMAYASSCPGMVFPQLAMGVPSAPITLAGAVVGGIFWSAVLKPWIAGRLRRGHGTGGSGNSPKTLAQLFGTGRVETLVCYEILLGAIVVTVAGMAVSEPSALQPIAGGLVIGGAQLISLLTRGSPVGVSTCYEHIGDWVLYLLEGARGPRPPTATLLFSASMMAGARLLAYQMPALAVAPGALAQGVTSGNAFWGGFLMAVGSRLGGGCSSGHGISGMGLMSVASFVSMFAAFAAAFAVAGV